MNLITRLLLLSMAVLAIAPLDAHARPNSPRRPEIRGLPALTELETGKKSFRLTLTGLRGIDSVTLRRDDRVLKFPRRTSARLFRGTIARSGRTAPISADLIGNRFTLRYVDFTGKPAAITVTFSPAGRVTSVFRSIRPSRSLHPCGAPVAESALAELSTATSPAASSFLLPLLSPVRVLDIAVYGDYELGQELGESAEAQLEAIINSVDTLFEDQLGISLRITGTHLFTSSANLGASTNPGVVLDEFRDTVGSDSSLPRGDSFHLFTGRNLAGNVVGLSYTGVVCRAPGFSFGLSQSVGDATQPLITAHELAHSLGASHTNPGAGLMSPTIEPGLDTFAGKSLSEILAFTSKNGSCLGKSGNSVTLSGKIVAGNRLAATATVQGPVSSGCTLSLFGSKKRPHSIGAARTGTRLSTRTLTALGATRWNLPLAGTGPRRRYFLTATVECPISDELLAFGASQPLAVESSNRAFLKSLNAMFDR